MQTNLHFHNFIAKSHSALIVSLVDKRALSLQATNKRKIMFVNRLTTVAIKMSRHSRYSAYARQMTSLNRT